MDENSCCFLGPHNIPDSRSEYTRLALQSEIASAVADGYTLFIVGLADEMERTFAECIVKLKQENLRIKLEAAIPFREQFQMEDTHFRRLLSQCDIVGCHSETCGPDAVTIRNRHMVYNARRVIVVYEGNEPGEVADAIKLAKELGRELRVIQI